MSRTPRKLYQKIASLIAARNNCRKSNNNEWLVTHEDTIEFLVKNYMPSGSGIDCGTQINLEKSTPEKLVFTFSYHHMNEGGMYDGWTEHTLTVRPSLAHDIDIRISGRDRNQIKEYLYETYQHALTQEVWVDEQSNWHSSLYEAVS